MFSKKQTIRTWFTYGYIFEEYDCTILEISLELVFFSFQRAFQPRDQHGPIGSEEINLLDYDRLTTTLHQKKNIYQ